MTDKEELIRAAETLKKYCDEHKGACVDGNMEDCLFSQVCSQFSAWYNVGVMMKDFAHDMRYSDDE